MCEVCGGNGFYQLNVPLGHPRFGQAIPCTCRHEQRNATRQRKLEALDGLNDREREHTFETTKLARHQHEVRVALSEAKTGMFTLQGRPGCGKTHYMHCVVNQARSEGRVAVYSTLPDLLDYLRAAFNPKNEEPYEERWKLLISCDVLALDELDEFNATDWAKERFLRLIDERHRNAHTQLTVLALNGEVDALPAKIVSRLKQGTVIKLAPVDMRQVFRADAVPA